MRVEGLRFTTGEYVKDWEILVHEEMRDIYYGLTGEQVNQDHEGMNQRMKRSRL